MKTIFILFTIFLLITSCNTKENTNTEKETNLTETVVTLTEAQFKNATIKTEKPAQRLIAYVLKANGKIEVPPQNMVSVSAQLGGYLKSSQLLPGMKIKKGEVIAVMEDQQYIQLQQEYLTTKTKLSYLEKEFDRQKELNLSKASSDKILQQTEADYTSQKIALKAYSEKLKLIGINPETLSESTISRNVNISSPIDGYVTKVNVNIGKYVNPSEVLFELVNPTDIHLSLTIFEKDINKLFVGQKLNAYTNNDPENKHACEIILIGQNLSAERSVEVHCHFENYDKTLLPGMYMNADIEVKSKNSLTVPTEAIVNHEGKTYIFIQVENYNFELTEVEIGNSENNFTELLNAEKIKNKNIVSKGSYSLLMSLKNKSE